MTLNDFNLNIVLTEPNCIAYQQAIADGDLAELRDILLRVCAPSERAGIRRLLPDNLVYTPAFKPVC